QMFQRLLFSRIVPCVRDIGLWGPRLRQAYADLGVLDMSEQSLDTLMDADEELADTLDAARFAAEEEARKAEVHAAIADGAASGRHGHLAPAAKRGPALPGHPTGGDAGVTAAAGRRDGRHPEWAGPPSAPGEPG